MVGHPLDRSGDGRNGRHRVQLSAAHLAGAQAAAYRLCTFKRSKDSKFATRLRDIVGLHMNPPAHAIGPWVEEKSQIQALDRKQPGLPLKPGKCGIMIHDCCLEGMRSIKRQGPTTLFAALPGLSGGRCCAGRELGTIV